MHTQRHIQMLEDREARLLEAEKVRDLRDETDHRRRQLMLQALEVDSKRWPHSTTDVNAQVDKNVVLPATVLHYEEYLKRLQRLAFLSEVGDYEKMEKVLDKQSVIDEKNRMLVPFYRELKAAIRRLTNTEDVRILKEYKQHLGQITRSLNYKGNIAAGPSEEHEAAVAADKKALREAYTQLLAQHYRKQREPEHFLNAVEKKLTGLFHVVSIWLRYVNIVYMPENEVELNRVAREDPATHQMLMGEEAGEAGKREEEEKRFVDLF